MRELRHGLIDRIASRVTGLSASVASPSIADNRALLEELGQPACMAELLRQVRADRPTLRAVAARSYPHVNQFDKIVLVGSPDRAAYRLTLHLWEGRYSEDQTGEELIHDHRFNFWSVVLAGALVSQPFEGSESGKAYRRYRYFPETFRGRSFSEIYEFTGDTKLRATACTTRTRSESYFLSAENIHRIVLQPARLTCSLVLRGPRLRRYSCVYNTTYPAETARISSAMFSEEQLDAKLANLLREVEAPP